MKRVRSFILYIVTAVCLFGAGVTPDAPVPAVSAEPTKLVAFTFDDGPSFRTPSLLDGLASVGAKATFFCNGENGGYAGAAHRSDDVERMLREGHQVANHTYAHRVPFDGLTAAEMRSEAERVNALLYRAAGRDYQTLVRTPGGAVDDTIRGAIDAPIILWSVDTMDWRLQDADAICEAIINNVQDGSVILLHDLYEPSIKGALDAMRILKLRGYHFVTVSELFRRRGVTLENGKVYTGVYGSEVDLPPYEAPSIAMTDSLTAGHARMTLTHGDSGMTLYYTLDGSAPTLASSRYTGPVDVPFGAVLTVAGYDRFATRTPTAAMTSRSQYEGVFDAAYYVGRYPELRLLGDDEETLLSHFLNYGLYEGKQASPVFCVNYYMHRHPSLKDTLGTDKAAYMRHFLSVGMSEGLRGSEEFDPMSYRLQYADLRRIYKDDWKGYYSHYLHSGRAAGRQGRGCTYMQDAMSRVGDTDYSAVYNYEYYTWRYPDVKEAYGLDDAAVFEHFLHSGMKEGRRAAVRFDPSSYYKEYPDLREALGAQRGGYYVHYMQSGQAEGRRARGCVERVGTVTRYQDVDYAAVYDFAYYRERYPEVKNALGDDDAAVLHHFLTTGMKEGRQAIADFDPLSYGRQYADLRRSFGADYAKYYRHFLNVGKREGRQGTGCTQMQDYATVYNGVNYASVYDYNEYVSRYPDVFKTYGLNDKAVLAHFVTCGMKEGRQASPLFSAKIYRERYGDLDRLYGDSWVKYYRHYLRIGQKEGRIGR